MTEISALLTDPAAWAALATLVVMELVLGVDNLVFLALVSARVEPSRRAFARRLGLGAALALRLALLGAVAGLVSLTSPLFTILDHGFSLRDLVLLGGGFFLIFKATQEIHDSEGELLPKEAMIVFEIEGGRKVAVRPSGTEPKIKYYLYATEKPASGTFTSEELLITKQRVTEGLERLWQWLKSDAGVRAQ